MGMKQWLMVRVGREGKLEDGVPCIHRIRHAVVCIERIKLSWENILPVDLPIGLVQEFVFEFAVVTI